MLLYNENPEIFSNHGEADMREVYQRLSLIWQNRQEEVEEEKE